MREALINGYKHGVYLQPTRADQYCVHNREAIPEGTTAVSVNTRNYLVWLSVPAVDELTLDLERFDFDDADYGELIGSEGKMASKQYRRRDDRTNVAYSRSTGGDACAVCNDSIGYHSPGVKLVNPKNSTRTVWIHPECVDEFINGLDRVWEHADQLLAEYI